jgi:hypothetical protein
MTGVLNHLIDAVFSWPVFILLATLVLWKLVMALVIVWRVTDV